MSDRIRSYVMGEVKRNSMRDALPFLCGKWERALFLVSAFAFIVSPLGRFARARPQRFALETGN